MRRRVRGKVISDLGMLASGAKPETVRLLDFVSALVQSKDGERVRTMTRNTQPFVKSELVAIHGPKCQACDTCMPDESLVHIHHVIPVQRGGDNRSANVVLLCPNCHARAHWLDRKLTEESRPSDSTELLSMLKAS